MKLMLGENELPLISSTSITKLNPTITWQWPTLQTLVATELYEEVVSNRHRVYGFVKFKWSGGSQSSGQYLHLFTLSDMPLPKDASVNISVLESATDGNNGGGAESLLRPEGMYETRTQYQWDGFNNWYQICNLEYSWVES